MTHKKDFTEFDILPFSVYCKIKSVNNGYFDKKKCGTYFEYIGYCVEHDFLPEGTKLLTAIELYNIHKDF